MKNVQDALKQTHKEARVEMETLERLASKISHYNPRKEYMQAYYKKNAEKKNAAAKERYQIRKRENV